MLPLRYIKFIKINLFCQKCAELADKCRLKGNLAFKDRNIDLAIKCYNKAIELYPNNHSDLALTYSNRAACYLKWVF